MMMTMVTLITANITPTIIPILELLEELLTGIEDEVAEVDTAMAVVVECVSNTLELVEAAVITVVVVVVVVVVVAMMVEVEVVKETAMIGFLYSKTTCTTMHAHWLHLNIASEMLCGEIASSSKYAVHGTWVFGSQDQLKCMVMCKSYSL